MKKNRRFECPACGDVRQLTRHHIIPRRFNEYSEDVIMLCRECHNEIERWIPQREYLPEEEYYQIVEDFLYYKQKEREGVMLVFYLDEEWEYLGTYDQLSRMLTSGVKYEVDLYKGNRRVSAPIDKVVVLKSVLQARKDR